MPQRNIPAQPALKRIRNFSEVVVGINKKQSIEDAKVYLERESSIKGDGCPLGTDAFGFLRVLSRGDFSGALEVIYRNNPLPSVTGRLCAEPFAPTQVFNRLGEPISLRALERCISDNAQYRGSAPASNGKKVAVIGSGPSGLTAAALLAGLGCAVTVFESMHKLGGALRFGIPEFRLPKKVLDEDIRHIQSLGVQFKTDFFLGQSASLEELKKTFDAIYLSTGAGVSQELNIKGQEVPGVYNGDEFLTRVNVNYAEEELDTDVALPVGSKVIVIGGGHTAFDCARSCIRLGCTSVTILLRKTESEVRARSSVVDYAKEEGVRFEVLANPVEILTNEHGFARALKCRRFDYADPDGDERWKLLEVEGSDFELEADTIIYAVGHQPNILFTRTHPDLQLNENGTVWTRENSSQTSIEGVFAGGNVTDGPGGVMDAMLSAKLAVAEMEECLNDKESN